MPSGRLLIVLLLAGCAAVRSYDFELSGTLSEAAVGDVDGAIKRLELNNAGADKDLLYYFERGMLERLRNRADDSQRGGAAAQRRSEPPATVVSTGAELMRSASSYVLSDKLRVYEA